MSAHCMHGYMIWAALRSSLSPRPMICEQRRMRFRLLRRAMSMTSVQYSSLRARMSTGKACRRDRVSARVRTRAGAGREEAVPGTVGLTDT